MPAPKDPEKCAEWKRSISETHKGIHNSTKTEFKKGMIPWNKGLFYGVGERFRGRIMDLTIYRNWRLEIKKRDENRCKECHSEVKFEVDHYPKTFAQIILENNIKTILEAKECVELWQIDNGRTLCNLCHKKTETYGKKLYDKRLLQNS